MATYADKVIEQGIPTLAEAVLRAWARFGKLAGEEPTQRERTMAQVAAEVMWASAVAATIKSP